MQHALIERTEITWNPVAGSCIHEIFRIKHHRRDAEVKRGLESSGHLRRVSCGSNLRGRCDV